VTWLWGFTEETRVKTALNVVASTIQHSLPSASFAARSLFICSTVLPVTSRNTILPIPMSNRFRHFADAAAFAAAAA